MLDAFQEALTQSVIEYAAEYDDCKATRLEDGGVWFTAVDRRLHAILQRRIRRHWENINKLNRILEASP